MNKKRLYRLVTVILTAAILLSVGGTATAAPAGVQAAPNTAKVYINNINVTFEAYTIDGNNYFKLRDLAKAFMGTSKQFSVEWDSAANAVRLMGDQRYSPIGNELTVSGTSSAVTAVPTAAAVYFNGKLLNAKAYAIGGYNYFKLRDIGTAMNFSVTYDDSVKSIKMDLTKEYYLPAILEILSGAIYDPTAGVILYNRTDSGSMTITRYSPFYYGIVADNISGDQDFVKLKGVIGVFTGAPDQVLSAAESSKTEGQKELQIDGRTFKCIYIGQKLTITINWL